MLDGHGVHGRFTQHTALAIPAFCIFITLTAADDRPAWMMEKSFS